MRRCSIATSSGRWHHGGAGVITRTETVLWRPFGAHLAPQARVSLLWDIGGNVPGDWRLGSHDESEQAHLSDMLGSLGAGDLLLADRLYPSRALMVDCMARGIDFIFRLKTVGQRAMHEVQAFTSDNGDDQTMELHSFPGIMVRIVRGYRPGTEDCLFVTSLRDVQDHSREAIADLYQRRWGVETAY